MALEAGVAQRIALVDVVSGLLDKGTVVSGQATVSVAGVDLVHIALQLLVSSVETLRQSGGPPVLEGAPPLGPGPISAAVAGAETAPGSGSLPSSSGRSPAAVRPPTAPRTRLLVGEPSMSGPRPQTEPTSEEDRGLAGLVLALVELIRQLLERQAVRRMEGGALTEDEVERMGRALLDLNAKMKELFALFGLDEADVSLDLGPLGQLI